MPRHNPPHTRKEFDVLHFGGGFWIYYNVSRCMAKYVTTLYVKCRKSPPSIANEARHHHQVQVKHRRIAIGGARGLSTFAKRFHTSRRPYGLSNQRSPLSCIGIHYATVRHHTGTCNRHRFGRSRWAFEGKGLGKGARRKG